MNAEGEWQRFLDGGFISFPLEASLRIEQAFHQTHERSVDIESLNTTVHFDTMRDNYLHPIRRRSFKSQPDMRWEYQENNYWMDFNVHICEFLTIMYETGRSRSIVFEEESFYEIHIDLSLKEYFNSNNSRRGMIRYVPLAVPRGEQRRLMIESILSRMLRVSSTSPEDICAICMDSYDADHHSAFQLPSCIHHFHKACIQQQVLLFFDLRINYLKPFPSLRGKGNAPSVRICTSSPKAISLAQGRWTWVIYLLGSYLWPPSSASVR